MNVFITKLFILFLGITISSRENLTLKRDLVIDDVRISSTLDLEVQVDAKGQIYIANKDQNSIWLYTSGGILKKRISRSGQGPGEFNNLGDIYLDQNGMLYGLDGNLSKVAIFSPPSYKIRKEIIIQPVTGQSMQKVIAPESSCCMITFFPYITLRHPKQGKNWLYQINEKGNRQDTVLSYFDDQMFVYKQQDNISTLEVPFGYKTFLKVGPEGKIYLGKTDESQIRIFNKHGDFIKKMTIQHKSIPVPTKILDKYRSFAYSDNRGAQIFKKLLETDVIPNVKPIYDWFEVDDKQRIWMAVNTKDPQHYSVRIYNLKGELITKTELSKAVELKEIKDGYAYGVKKGEKGLQSVVRYNINGLNGE